MNVRLFAAVVAVLWSLAASACDGVQAIVRAPSYSGCGVSASFAPSYQVQREIRVERQVDYYAAPRVQRDIVYAPSRALRADVYYAPAGASVNVNVNQRRGLGLFDVFRAGRFFDRDRDRGRGRDRDGDRDRGRGRGR